MNTAHMTSEERMKTFELAMGRILRLGSRPYQEGDIEEYERCRAIIMSLAEASKNAQTSGWSPNYARDRKRGAAGD